MTVNILKINITYINSASHRFLKYKMLHVSLVKRVGTCIMCLSIAVTILEQVLRKRMIENIY